MKSAKYIITILFVGLAISVWGQSAQAAVPAESGPEQLGKIMTYVLASAGALLFIVAMFYVVRVNQFLYKRVLELQAGASGVALPDETAVPQEATENIWSKLKKRFWEDAVPIEREGDIISHHDFDGIRELDNSLPPWWVNLFILTVIYAAIYMFYFHFGGGGPSQAEEYEMNMEKAKRELAVALANKANDIDESSVVALTESGDLGEGELIFKNSCAACHGMGGEGGIGPNLTDEYWIHGGGIKNIFKTVKYGVPEKGMIAWSSQLKAADMQKVSSYILTLAGTNPANAKEPQGEIWKEEAEAPADSTAAPEPGMSSI